MECITDASFSIFNSMLLLQRIRSYFFLPFFPFFYKRNQVIHSSHKLFGRWEITWGQSKISSKTNNVSVFSLPFQNIKCFEINNNSDRKKSLLWTLGWGRQLRFHQAKGRSGLIIFHAHRRITTVLSWSVFLFEKA